MLLLGRLGIGRSFKEKPKCETVNKNKNKMPTTCVVPKCKTGYPSDNPGPEKTSFFKFPTDLGMKEEWTKKIRREN